MTHPPACTGTKQCCRCHEEKHVLAFAACPDTRDGCRPECRECGNAAKAKPTIKRRASHGIEW